MKQFENDLIEVIELSEEEFLEIMFARKRKEKNKSELAK